MQLTTELSFSKDHGVQNLFYEKFLISDLINQTDTKRLSMLPSNFEEKNLNSLAHILLVEDNAMIQKIHTTYLKSWGYEVTLAKDGLEAITQFKDNDFDLVLLDIGLPNLDGYDVCAVLRNIENLREKKVTPILVVSAFNDIELNCQKSGADYSMQKPPNYFELENKIKELIGNNNG